MDDKFIHAPIDQMSTPCDGEVMLNRYWCVHPEKGLAFWQRAGVGSYDLDRLSPQCNADKKVADHICEHRPDHVVQKVPAVYIGNLQKIFTTKDT
jgi:hypothetical protein